MLVDEEDDGEECSTVAERRICRRARGEGDADDAAKTNDGDEAAKRREV